MLINADFSRRAIVAPHQYQWIPSPQEGVERVMLDRVGAEKARATSIVRYAPGSRFPRHEHPGGEEILVLSGTFSDEEGDYPAGSYLRNPPGSGHAPCSREGTTIFVKLWQMPAVETHSVRIDTRDPAHWRAAKGREACFLFSDAVEHVSLVRVHPDLPLFDMPVNAAEILVLDGALREGSVEYPRGTWLRMPSHDCPVLIAGTQGATVYMKAGRTDVGSGPESANA